MNSSNCMLETSGITKRYGSLVALDDVSLRFDNEKIYGLFGRNGAGKTSLLNIISSRMFADAGTVSFHGTKNTGNPDGIAPYCCYMPEKHYFPERLKVKKLLDLFERSFPQYDPAYAQLLCRKFRLNTEQKYGRLSRGHQSIFRIVLGLASRADVTIFDEPVLGLDAVARDGFYGELIEDFTKHPRLIIVSTHLIEESADLFNEAVIIDEGRIVRQASVEELLDGAYYVSGKLERVDAYLKNRATFDTKTMNGMKMAVVDGRLYDAESEQGLNFAPLSIQKLFIHLTNDQIDEEQNR